MTPFHHVALHFTSNKQLDRSRSINRGEKDRGTSDPKIEESMCNGRFKSSGARFRGTSPKSAGAATHPVYRESPARPARRDSACPSHGAGSAVRQSRHGLSALARPIAPVGGWSEVPRLAGRASWECVDDTTTRPTRSDIPTLLPSLLIRPPRLLYYYCLALCTVPRTRSNSADYLFSTIFSNTGAPVSCIIPSLLSVLTIPPLAIRCYSFEFSDSFFFHSLVLPPLTICLI